MPNKIILAALAAGFLAQIIKLIIYWFRHKTLSLHDLVVTGGMPSSHTAFVISLATIIYVEEGASTAFAISLILAIIIVRDAFGVRRAVGEEGLVLEKIVKKLKLKQTMHYSLGHTPLQVATGAILGFMSSMIIHYLL